MSETNYLLFIDENPVTEEIKNYFYQFNIAVVTQATLTSRPHSPELLTAILIHWSLLKNELEAIHQLYNKYPIPLLIISDFPNEEACIKVLEAGADDFIIKPIYPKALHARIKAINRRVLSKPKKNQQDTEVWIFSNWRLCPSSRQVFNHLTHKELELSAGEYDLLISFLQQPQGILDREFILQASKKNHFNPLDRRIDVQISRLRQKIELDAKNPQLIKTVRNKGYIFTAKVIIIKE